MPTPRRTGDPEHGPGDPFEDVIGQSTFNLAGTPELAQLMPGDDVVLSACKIEELPIEGLHAASLPTTYDTEFEMRLSATAAVADRRIYR
jgi:hypothetical protein